MRIFEIAKEFRRREEEANEISKRRFFETFSRHFRKEVPLLREAGIQLNIEWGVDQWCVVMSHPRYEPRICLQVSGTGAFSYWVYGCKDLKFGITSSEFDREAFIAYLVASIHLSEEAV